MSKPRQYGFDNIRFILIFCVVFGHLLEFLGKGQLQDRLYLTIYTFHMPVFLFLSGYFAKFDLRKLLRIALLYLVFQAVYQAGGDLSSGRSLSIQFRRPDWLMWYLPVLVYCQLLLPALDRLPCLPVLAVSIGLSLAAGCFDGIGYDLSLSRFFVFCPYFILGYHTGRGKWDRRIPAAGGLIFLGAILILCPLLLGSGKVNALVLYGSFSYRIGYGPMTRLLLYLLGFSWVGLFLVLARTVLDRRIPLVSAIGRNTLPIYLLHGIAVKLLHKWGPAPAGLPGVLLALGLTVLLLIILGSPPLGRVFSPGIPGRKK